MRCFMKNEDKSLIDVEHFETTLISTIVLSSPHWPPFSYSFVSSISVLLLSHSVQLMSLTLAGVFIVLSFRRYPSVHRLAFVLYLN